MVETVGLDAQERQALLERVSALSHDIRDELDAVQQKTGAKVGDEDPILLKLERLLDGRVTAPLAQEELG